ncbi:MAG: hypothetical protein J5486_07575 [Bacteroidaceae bacterium]|nr:hypothetical protein [Bacteroidaceae bacterium]
MQEHDFFKPTYTTEERQECIEWFNQHMDKLPTKLRLNKSSVSHDLPYTVKRLILLQSHASADSSVYSGYTANLMLIRQRLRELPTWEE